MAAAKINQLVTLYNGVAKEDCDRILLTATLSGQATSIKVACELPLSTSSKGWTEELCNRIVQHPTFPAFLSQRVEQKKLAKVERNSEQVVAAQDYLEYSKALLTKDGVVIKRNDESFLSQLPSVLALDSEGREPVRLAQLFAGGNTVYVYDYPESNISFMEQVLYNTNVVKVVCDAKAELAAFKVRSLEAHESVKNGVMSLLKNQLQSCNLTGTEQEAQLALYKYLKELEESSVRARGIVKAFHDIQAGRPTDRKSLISIIEDLFSVRLVKPDDGTRTLWGDVVAAAQLEYAAYDAMWNWVIYKKLL